MPRASIHMESRRGNWTPEYRAWWAMKSRCEQPGGARFDRYGGRGIKVCDRWRDSYPNFLADMGRRPSPEHSIDRIDNNGNYEPGNVRWATRAEQNANKTQRASAIMVEHDGVTLDLSAWAKRTGIPCSVLRKRIRRGWQVDRALTEAPRVQL